MLEYENQLLLESVQENDLKIFARGISTEKVLVNLFKCYATQENLVFVLSTSSSEEKYYLDRLKKDFAVSITTEFNPNERKELYLRGGIFFITARILVVDFLKDIVPAEKITGVIVLKAHNVIETSQEAFILRLYRTKNKTGFIKAFSQSPTTFLLGFNRVSKVMRCCFISNVSLWPRFHAAIKESLSKYATESNVVEIQLKLSTNMREIQQSLLDLVSLSLGELKRLVPALNDDQISLESALTKGFHKIVDSFMDPVWNSVVPKSKGLLNDIKLFRLLLSQLTKCDCVTFYTSLCSFMGPEAALKSSWVLSNSAEKMIIAAKKRFLKKEKGEEVFSFEPEVHPKWLALSEILNELCIKEEKIDELSEEKEGESGEKPCEQLGPSRERTIIFAEDVKTCGVLRDYLSYGSELTLGRIARNSESVKIPLSNHLILKLNEMTRERKVKKVDPIEEGAAKPKEAQITLTQIERKYEDIEFLQKPIFIRPLKFFGEQEPFAVTQTLETLLPHNLILFDPTLELIRNIEVYRARYGGEQGIRVYFLSFHNSVEEQIYLTSIQREKTAFERLIGEKLTMVVPVEREGRDELNQDLWRDPSKASETLSLANQSSKRDMEGKIIEKEIVLVDMREFRSELPSLIHKRGIDLEPLTLDVGDYILTNEVCVERKSLSDLIESLGCGRLYKQAEAMSRHYKKPILLVENETSQASAVNKYKNEMLKIMPKLQLLTLHFPKLKIIWSPSSYYTAEMFHELKRGRSQPVAEIALSIQKEMSGSEKTMKFSPISHSFLSKLPGIDSRNVYTLLNRCKNLDEVVQKSEDELSAIIGSSKQAEIFYAGIHTNLRQHLEAEPSGKTWKGKPGSKK